MEESIQIILIQTTCIVILFVTLLQVVGVFVAMIKRQIREKYLFELESVLLQKKIDQQVVETSLIKQRNDNTWSGYRKFTINKKELVKSTGTCSFYLIPHDGKAIPGFFPGQHLFFRVSIPGHKKQLLRCYSISSSALIKEYYRISFKKALPPATIPTVPTGAVSGFFYDNLKQGDIIDVRSPSGKFYLNIHSSKPVVLIAGGIGITPLLSMLDTIIDMGSQREVWFFLSVKNSKNNFMQEYLTKMAVDHENVHVHICYSSPQPEDIQGLDYNHAERVSVALLKKYLPSNNFEFYFCGPASMNSRLKDDLAHWGVGESSINFEQFSSPKRQGEKDFLKADKMEATIEFSKSNKSLKWCNQDASILDLALSNGIAIDYSCKRGMCGLCQTTIKSGEVFYDSPPEFLADLESGMCLLCVAKTKKGLELDA